MRKVKFTLFVSLFFLCCCGMGFSFENFFYKNLSFGNKTYATFRLNRTNKENNLSNYIFEFEFEGQIFRFNTANMLNDLNLTEYQKNIFKTKFDRLGFAKDLLFMGFSRSEAISYAFPEMEIIIQKLSSKLNTEPEPSTVYVEKNKCKLKFISAKNGRFLNLYSFYDQILKHTNTRIIKVKLELTKISSNLTQENEYLERGSFSTSFSTSSEARKNNIKTALAAFDGLVLEIGECFSFNQTTGRRIKENGYSAAKIISGGTFIEGFGGGVCQVSTTIYNACLLAGLEIVEVHNHSLPVGYVEPSFDAMVNTGSSDLIVKNNTTSKIIITTSNENNMAKVKIFGANNPYKIIRVSEKLKIIPAEQDFEDTNLSKYGDISLEVGECKRLSYPKDGYTSKGYLQYYDKNGVLQYSKHIRTDTYSPVKGIILKRER